MSGRDEGRAASWPPPTSEAGAALAAASAARSASCAGRARRHPSAAPPCGARAEALAGGRSGAVPTRPATCCPIPARPVRRAGSAAVGPLLSRRSPTAPRTPSPPRWARRPARSPSPAWTRPSPILTVLRTPARAGRPGHRGHPDVASLGGQPARSRPTGPPAAGRPPRVDLVQATDELRRRRGRAAGGRGGRRRTWRRRPGPAAGPPGAAGGHPGRRPARRALGARRVGRGSRACWSMRAAAQRRRRRPARS